MTKQMTIRIYKAQDNTIWTQLLDIDGVWIAEARGKHTLKQMIKIAGF